ncbi:sulfatase family protein [Aspergillus ibericus CBS 121593]|uniref:Alkaline phosphatase-like protein n=1 Tax=Aspergillus ibericus CBS 121593 TaxID=1448316 RepID=A0A395HEI2_9EURO|nr:alkaline phosphatase-like protein [Aspergillus ibericus CBS 121593]RAL05398.1 alkaline phosphatase-like protein [Aspergillus ibericus CBS 121593]
MTQPNILFLMADDHASKAISAYTPPQHPPLNSTPHIDRLSHEGMKFNHCYVTNSICTPSRATILTGTHNHVNGVLTLADKINNRLPNVAKHLQSGGYQTAMIGKWHLGEGRENLPTGFDYWSVLPGQGRYFDPEFISIPPNPRNEKGNGGGIKSVEKGYATDIITEKSLQWLNERDVKKPFFLMCHHKAPHRSWECRPDHRGLYTEDVALPDTFNDEYKNRAKAAGAAKMRIQSDITYFDLGLVQPEGGEEVGELFLGGDRKIPDVRDEEIAGFKLVDKDTAEVFTFASAAELKKFKYQRYLKRYLRTIHSIDENVGRLLDYLDEEGLTENTVVMYTSDQGFFLGEHGWFDKRFMYEESFQMPFLIRYPRLIQPGSVCEDIISNVDFARTWLELAGLRVPSYMQGVSFVPLLEGRTPAGWKQVAYHRYWMHRDTIHNAYAHYGVRNQRYKLIYWYAEGFDLPGTQEGGQPREWELFDCVEDPLELFNVYQDPKYKDVVVELTRLLEETMLEIGDIPVH